MRGKRFLELKLVPVQPKTNSVDGASNGSAHGTPDTARTNSPARNSGSMWGINTKRLFGSSGSSSASGSNTTSTNAANFNSPASPVPQPSLPMDPVMALVTHNKKRVLFVQDNKHLFIVTCEKADAQVRSGFKVLIAAPLLYTGKCVLALLYYSIFTVHWKMSLPFELLSMTHYYPMHYSDSMYNSDLTL